MATTEVISGGCGCCGTVCSEFAIVAISDYMTATRQFYLSVSPYFGQESGTYGVLDGNNGEWSYTIDTINFILTVTTHADLTVTMTSHCGQRQIVIPSGTVLTIENFHQTAGSIVDTEQATLDTDGTLEIINI